MASRNLDKLASRRRPSPGRGSTSPAGLDQARQESVMALAAVVQQAGGVDVLVNNAVLRPIRDWKCRPRSSPSAWRSMPRACSS